MGVIPELLCTDLSKTRSFYLDVLGFHVEFERPAETFIYLRCEGIDLMFEQADGPGRRWMTGLLERPFGRGINLYIESHDVAEFFVRLCALAPQSVYMPLEDKAYRCGERVMISRQFIVQDPDGYLLRFGESVTE